MSGIPVVSGCVLWDGPERGFVAFSSPHLEARLSSVSIQKARQDVGH
jgi:hypothetical protein